jgi:ketosteroid isomerase-like protein
MSARTPEDTHALLEAAFNAGDLDAFVDVYEQDATLMLPPGGAPARGHEEIRRGTEPLFALYPRARIEVVGKAESDGLALTLAQWTVVGTGPDGDRVDRDERVMRGAQLLAGVHSAALAAQPFPVEQLRPRQLWAEACASEARDRLAVLALGGVGVAEQCADAGFDPEHPVGAGHPGALRQPLECGLDEPRSPVLDAASASSATTNGPYATSSRCTKAARAPSRAAS